MKSVLLTSTAGPIAQQVQGNAAPIGDEWLVERIGPGSSTEAPPQARAVRYRRYATDIRAKAESIKDPIVSSRIWEVAHEFDLLADSLERRARGR